ncbi:MAG: TolC family protein [Deltaproteobacteria bacterium]|nr:MAG: TolC family protein [Deltaproteobacteria bacterium]
MIFALALALLGQAAGPRVLTLEEALRTARERQPQLRQARAATGAAGARSSEAFAALLPQLTATASYQRTTANFINRPGSAPRTFNTDTNSSFSLYNFFSGNISASQLLWDFGAAPNRWRAARAQEESSVSSERATALLVGFNVRSAYFAARASRSLVKVARDSLDNFNKHLEQIEAFVGAGTRPDIDLAQARTDSANARVTLINAENTYLTAKAQLNQAMGIEGPVDYDIADEALPPIKGEEAELPPLLEEALKARPEVASLEQQVRAQQLTASSIEGQYGPSLAATLGFTQGGTSISQLGWNASAGLTLSWNLFQGGLTRAQVREAEANAAGAVAQLDILRQQIRLDLDQARLAVRAARESVGAAQEALINARERLRLAEGRYETGVGSVIELGDAQVALTSAAAQAVQADDRLATARAQLLHALGRE